MSKSSGKVDKLPKPKSIFISMGVDMSWRLAIGVLVPIIGGVELDKVFKTSPILLFVGLALAVAGTALVIRRTVKLANEHPVLNPPKKEGLDG